MFLGVEFISLLVLIVYVGAISTLFLFIIMMLNSRVVEVHGTFFHYLPVGSFIGFFFILELISFVFHDFGFFTVDAKVGIIENYNWIRFLHAYNNIVLIGQLLFNYYIHLFVAVSILLFCAMIGAIVLTGYNSDSLMQSDKKFLLKNINSMNRTTVVVLKKKKKQFM